MAASHLSMRHVLFLAFTALELAQSTHLRQDRRIQLQSHSHPQVYRSNRSSFHGSLSCPHEASKGNASVHLHGARQSRRSASTSLRVCNALTMERVATLDVLVNGKKLNADVIKPRKCLEFTIPITATNKFEVKLVGQVKSAWSEEKSETEMTDIPVLFLVAYAFGNGDDSIFTVNEFHGDSNGLKSTQVAYMDLFRGAPPAKVRLLGADGEFELEGGSYTSICAGEYELEFLHEGAGSPLKSASTLTTAKGEQYVLVRLAPEGTSRYEEVAKLEQETVLIFPETNGGPFEWLGNALDNMADQGDVDTPSPYG